MDDRIVIIGLSAINAIDTPPDPLFLTMLSMERRFEVRIQQAGHENWFIHISDANGGRIAVPVAAYATQETAIEVAMLLVQRLAAGIDPSRLDPTGKILS